MRIQFPRRTWMALGGAALLLLAGCGSGQGTTAKKLPTYSMGAQVTVGPLTYTALETEWKSSFDSPTGPRQAQHQFLLIKLTVTNGGGGEVIAPLLYLVDGKGKEWIEDDKGEGIPQWLGTLRMLGPAQTSEGYLLFDVPQGSYQLRVSTGGDPEKEVAALVTIPFRLDSGAGGGVPEVQVPAPK